MKIVDYIKRMHKGDELYSPICGVCKLVTIDESHECCILVEAEGATYCFTADGKVTDSGECVLFPSEHHRSWSRQHSEINIPKTISVGGVKYEIKIVERCDDIGLSSSGRSIIEIAEKFDKDKQQSISCARNTFFHELVHAILDTMGERELSCNEKFVSCFASFLNESMKEAKFV